MIESETIRQPAPAKAVPSRLPKLCGADIELGNFILGASGDGETCFQASRALLREIPGLPLPENPHSDTWSIDRRWPKAPVLVNPQDWGRRYLPANGGCAYIDLDHLELCLPEVLSAYDHLGCWHAMLRIAQRALAAANEKLPPGQRIQVLVNNSDGRGNSYGSHLNFLVSRRAWDNIFRRRIQYMLYLAAFQASSIVFTGQGKVGSENGAPPVGFQISQRADFFETLLGSQTTHRRPIVNSRDEPLCGRSAAWQSNDHGAASMARLHVIFFDNTLSHVASLLKVGVMQIILAMIEAERINPNLILDDPVDTVVTWSHDPSLQARAPLTSGHALTAVETQLLFMEDAHKFVAAGGCDGLVPRAGEILRLWEDTLLRLHARDFAALAPRLDWVLKLSILRRVIGQNPGLSWEAPQIKHLDHVFSSLDPDEGLYWPYESSGFTRRVVPEARIQYFMDNPPEDTRAWTRAMLLRRAGPAVEDADWDRIRFKTPREGYRFIYRTLEMANPLDFTREESESAFSAQTLEEILDGLEDPRDAKSKLLQSPDHSPWSTDISRLKADGKSHAPEFRQPAEDLCKEGESTHEIS